MNPWMWLRDWAKSAVLAGIGDALAERAADSDGTPVLPAAEGSEMPVLPAAKRKAVRP